MHDIIKAKVFNTEFFRNKLEFLNIKTAAKFFLVLITVNNTLRTRLIKIKRLFFKPFTEINAEKQQLKKLKSRKALFKKIRNTVYR